MADAVANKVENFFSQYRLVARKKGQILVSAGEEPGAVFYLTKGHVRQYDISYRGDEMVVNLFKPGAFFPMAWAINRTPNLYFFEAATDVEFHQAPADDAVAFLKKEPDVTFNLLSRVYNGTDGLIRRMAHLMGGNARTRLLFELSIACQRLGEKQDDGSIFIPLHESEFGDMAGMSRETVSREFKKFKEAGLVSVKHKGITVPDLANLDKALGTDL